MNDLLAPKALTDYSLGRVLRTHRPGLDKRIVGVSAQRQRFLADAAPWDCLCQSGPYSRSTSART